MRVQSGYGETNTLVHLDHLIQLLAVLAGGVNLIGLVRLVTEEI